MSRTSTLPQLFALDSLLDADEIAIRDSVRDFAASKLRPHIADWVEDARLPARDIARELGGLGALGMHLEGYGCPGMSAMSYGLTCLELEAVDSGIRSLVSVQGSLAMFSIHHWGSEEQKNEWLPRMAAGEAIGCFGLTEPDFGSNPSGMRTHAKRDGDDWVLNGTKMWITNGSIAAGSSSRPTHRGSRRRRSPRRCRCAPRSPPSSCSTTCAFPPRRCCRRRRGCADR